MQKPLFSTLFVLSLLSAGFTMHQAFAERSPSVLPITEVSIEENRVSRAPGVAETGFDFTDKKEVGLRESPTMRVPANIQSKSPSAPYSNSGPIIFLIALPLALWIVISRKMKSDTAGKKVDYYSKTFQFKSNKADYQESDFDDDQDFPKAS